ncbi:hypothetical protein Cch01nite_28680 [Cellulomonas chitinilytica]|uniref:Type II secretion system protein GspF domain-containing protein n=1 Tax=Cellulomonas chitinilytica TaxID=398759 RepID=A0A919P6A6_9CELL|nr:type II secretion protein F [Cellulomonas chitinilytica]GIG22144.1 hypothetical protein Cch01nite_28680 [Cellulomonas chitinilytica]
MSALLVGVAVAGTVLATCGPPARPPAHPVAPGRRHDRGWRLSRTATPIGPIVDLAAALHVVSAQLRAGATPATAWSRALGRGPAGGDVPTAAELVAATSPLPSRLLPPVDRAIRAVRVGLALGRAGGVTSPGTAAHRERVAAVLAATALADDLGAPLAGVLERLAGAIAADAEAEAEVRAAVAGPRATARVLTGLPLLGLLVGAALGADPVAAVGHGGAGALAAVLGVALLAVGRVWTDGLLRRAAASGRPS